MFKLGESFESVRIERTCILCHRPTHEVQNYTVQLSKSDMDWSDANLGFERILTVPFPAHKKCLILAKWLEGIIIAVIIFASLILTVQLFNVLVQPSNEATSGASSFLGLILGGVVSYFGVSAYLKYWKNRWIPRVRQYYKTHRND